MTAEKEPIQTSEMPKERQRAEAITREALFDCAKQLLAKGIRPSNDRIRQEIGGGPNTIGPWLRDFWQWMATLAAQADRGQTLGVVPKPVSQALLRLWTLAREHAGDELQNALSERTAALEEREHAVSQGETVLAERSAVLQQPMALLQQQLEIANARQAEHDQTQKRLATVEAQLAMAEAQLSQARQLAQAKGLRLEPAPELTRRRGGGRGAPRDASAKSPALARKRKKAAPGRKKR
jgi:hypothetical protein